MKSSTWKKILLGILTMVAIYIWWGNLESFYGQTYEVDSPRDQAVHDLKPMPEGPAGIEYIPPRVNPFRRFATAQPQPTRDERSQRNQPPPVSVPPIATQYTLTGLLTKQDRPQAVVRGQNQESSVITVGDSLGNWEVIAINERFLVCKQGTARDTLWHGSKDLR